MFHDKDYFMLSDFVLVRFNCMYAKADIVFNAG